MLKVNELRIGNFYKNERDIDCIFTYDLFEQLILNKITCNPIKLTEEWLKKLGFTGIKDLTYINGNRYILQLSDEKYDNINGTWFDGIGDYSWLKKEGLKTVVVNVLCRGNYICGAVEYVHELQNLYFALIREELEYNKLDAF